jgi:hypothetical protein
MGASNKELEQYPESFPPWMQEQESPLAILSKGADIRQQVWTGESSSTWKDMDKGELAKYCWSLASTYIPPLPAFINRLTKRKGASGTSYQVDLSVLTDFSGLGLTFTIQSGGD